jgi:hypothetical protein
MLLLKNWNCFWSENSNIRNLDPKKDRLGVPGTFPVHAPRFGPANPRRQISSGSDRFWSCKLPWRSRPIISELSSRYLNFTPADIRVANLIKEGKTNKEIAELMLISKNTVLFHRHHIVPNWA